MPFILIIVAIIAIVAVAVVGGRRARTARRSGDAPLTGDSGVASTNDPEAGGSV
ncbi:MAG TPA: hypothetical protein VFI28_07075 [Candidatus Limnocylindrales bacterium]|nr:hypothetical protein [Candidatus Limnocylindrales bacterium]